ncbi:MAG: hypothetical protein JWO94_2322 [Verrucomicrobiaceae bacterium]|nr:hypothetical protein [Verrucomicrobiaceae bacterium]
MKTPVIRTLAVAALGFGYSHLQLLAETVPPTNPGDHGTNAVPAMKPGTGTGTSADSGTTGKINPNSPADHGNNAATGKKIDKGGSDTNPTIVTPSTGRRNDPEAPAPTGTINNTGTDGVSPTNPADHGNNSSPGAKPGTGTNLGTSPTASPSTGNPNPADHGNNTGKGTNTATELKSR